MQYKKKRKKKSTMGSPEAYNPEKWEIEQDLNAVARAHAVKKDPERMKKCKALAKEKLDESKRKKDEAETLVDLGEGKTEV